jgi:hypothetical protein
MQRFVIALALLLSASTVGYAQVKPTRLGAIDFPDGSSIGVSAAGRARLRYHLGNNRLEVSLNGAAYTALNGGGSSSTMQDIYNNSTNPVRIIEDNTRSKLILRANSNGDAPLVFEHSSGTQTAYMTALGVLVSNGLLVQGDATARHYVGSSSTPTCAVGGALGTGSPSCSISGTDGAYEVTVTTGSSGAGTGTMVTVTSSAAWSAVAHCVMTPTTSGSGTALYAVYYDRAGSSTTTQVWGTANALSNGSTYKFDVLCIQ